MNTQNEYKQLVGAEVSNNQSGTHVINSQGAAEGFSRVSSLWLPKTMTFDEAFEKLETQRANRVDIKGNWEDWEFALSGRNIVLKNKDGREFHPTEYALLQAAGWSETPQGFIKQTLSADFSAKAIDLELLVQVLNSRKVRNHETNKKAKRELLFRTYKDNTLRAVLTTQYAPIDNVWLLKVMQDLIPDGRVSHFRGDADSIFTNILMPDSVRYDQDSDYGGLVNVKNSEIGNGSVDTQPSIFRAICMNGCIHQATDGVSLRQVHKGEIDLPTLAVKISENLDGQIKIMPEIMNKFLALRKYEFSEVGLTGVFAAIAERFKVSPKEITDTATQFAQFERDNRSAFGVVNAFTRAGQLYSPERCYDFDKIGGELISADWNNITEKAKHYTEKDLARIFGAAV